ncbi:MAG: membrane protein insertase YidC [Mycoplasmataceae bacterium]|nr:membrane protein insertase YidC [Mycoplasmataceae bacterium]
METTKNKKKKNQNKSIDSYFYSAKKKKSGTYKTDYKKIAKDGYKYTKWLVYLFLLIVSLWGCFQSFVVSTNPQLGLGLEVYTKYDDVYSNNFNVQPLLARATDETEPLEDLGGNPIKLNENGTTASSWEELGMKEAQSFAQYMSWIGANEYMLAINNYYNPEVDVIDGTPDTSDPATTPTDITDKSSNVLSVKQVTDALNASIKDFLTAGTYNPAYVYFVPDATYAGSSIAPSNIVNQAAIDERGDNWADNDAKSSDRIDNAGWTIGTVSTSEQHASSVAQSQFSDNESASYISIEEYFMDPLYPDSGMYYTDSTTSTPTAYAVSSDLYDLTSTPTSYSWDYVPDIYKAQEEVSKSISDHGVVSANSTVMNDKFDLSSTSSDPNISDISVKLYIKDEYDSYYNDYYTNPDAIPTKHGYDIALGGFAIMFNTNQTTELGVSFDEAFSAFNLGDVNHQIDSREIVVSWGDAWEFGPFYGLFVWPISQFSLWVGTWISWSVFGVWSAILGVIFIVLMLRLLSTLLSIKTFNDSAKTQEIQLKTAEVNAKYAMYDKSNKEMMSKKQQETTAIYKKEGVSPFGSIGTMLITMPIFLAMWRVISALPFYKIGAIGGVAFGSSSLSALFGGAPAALLIMIPVCTIQYISFKAPTWLAKKRKGIKNIDEKTKEAMKKSNRMSNFMGIFFIIIGLTIPSLLAIYWIVSGLYTIFISLIQHYLLVRKAENIKYERLGTSRKEELEKGNILPWYKHIGKLFESTSKKDKKDNDNLEEDKESNSKDEKDLVLQEA